MAFGTIVSEYGKGKYKVSLEVDTQRSENLKNRLTAKKTYMEDQLTTLESEYDDLLVEQIALEGEVALNLNILNNALDILNSQLNFLLAELSTLKQELSAIKQNPNHTQQEIDDKEDEIEAKEKEIEEKKAEIKAKEKEIEDEKQRLEDKQREVDTKKEQIHFTEIEIRSLTKGIERVTTYGYPIITSPQDVWCVDLTEGLSGKVALLEVATDPEEKLNIFPGYSGKVSPTIADHGTLEPFYSLGVPDSLRNFLMFPAIQKWKPSFRYGTLGAINYEENKATVYLDFLRSRIQDLGIDQALTLSNVPIEYMQCKAGAFEEGDKVVVQFIDHNWSTPKVIGFQYEPQPCGWEEPWSGPNLTSKYPWVYRGGAVKFGAPATIDPATISITNGIMTMSYPEIEVGAVGQEHYLQYVPENYIVMPNPRTVKFNASAKQECYSSGPYYYSGYTTFVGKNGNNIYNFQIFVINSAGYYPSYIGCEEHNYDETDWIAGRSGTVTDADVWWYDVPGTYNYQNYSRFIYEWKDTYMEFPVELTEVMAVEIGSEVHWVGGAGYNQPSTIAGSFISVDFMGMG